MSVVDDQPVRLHVCQDLDAGRLRQLLFIAGRVHALLPAAVDDRDVVCAQQFLLDSDVDGNPIPSGFIDTTQNLEGGVKRKHELIWTLLQDAFPAAQ